MSIVIDRIKEKLSKSNFKPTIVYPEGWNNSIIEAATQLEILNVVKPFLIFRTKKEVPENLKLNHLIIETADLAKYANALYELRKEKGMTLEQASELVKQPNYLASIMVKLGDADGEICGIEYTTKDTLKPALQIIKTAKGSKLVSSAFVMERNDDRYVFGDCAINLNPNSEELAEITKGIVNFAVNVLECDRTNVAMLSYSTNGSGQGESVEKVRKAYELIKDAPELKGINVFGEIQFDAAFVSTVREKKAKNLHWDKSASIYVFPNLDAGNIGYKIAQRMGGYEAIGPTLIGLAAPVNDLSRGASTMDVINLSYITAAQAIALKDKK